jgi:hypothetical protein
MITATRDAVTQMWRSVLDGAASRADAHAWASQWIEADDPDVRDPMVWSALQRLHGFDLVWTNPEHSAVRHGGSGDFVHSPQAIRSAFAAWQADCVSYDADPAEFVRRKKEAARLAANE